MKNQSAEVPDNFKKDWEAAKKELEEAAEELNRAHRRYHEAILARLALREKIETHENQPE